MLIAFLTIKTSLTNRPLEIILGNYLASFALGLDSGNRHRNQSPNDFPRLSETAMIEDVLR